MNQYKGTYESNMEAKKFYELVVRMRKMQKEYSRTRSSVSFAACKKLEKEIDDEIERVERIIRGKQKDLFNT